MYLAWPMAWGWEKVLRIHSCPHKAKVKKATDLRRGGGEGHQGEVLALLGEVVVGDGEAQHLGEVGQLLLGRHTLACIVVRLLWRNVENLAPMFVSIIGTELVSFVFVCLLQIEFKKSHAKTF